MEKEEEKIIEDPFERLPKWEAGKQCEVCEWDEVILKIKMSLMVGICSCLSTYLVLMLHF